MLNFSEQQLVDCSGGYKNEGCDGGDMSWSYYYVKDHGITTEDKYPYFGRDGTCKYDEAKMKAWTISDCVNVTPKK